MQSADNRRRRERGEKAAPGSHLEDGDLREVLLLEVGVRDELQLGLKEAVERLQEEHNMKHVLLF